VPAVSLLEIQSVCFEKSSLIRGSSALINSVRSWSRSRTGDNVNTPTANQ
jgi:hypothetical protein